MHKKVYTSGQAAEICGLSLSTFKRWVKKGCIRTYRTPGGDIRILHEQLLEFMKEYGIPQSRLMEEPKLMLYSKDDNRNLINNIYNILPDIQLFIVKNEVDAGITVANNKPWAVIFAQNYENISELSRKIKEYLAPDQVKTGIIGNATSGLSDIDSFLPNVENYNELELFLNDLLSFRDLDSSMKKSA